MAKWFKNKKFTEDYHRINTFAKRRLKAFSPHQFYAKKKLYQCIGILRMRNQMMRINKTVNRNCNSSINEESTYFTSSCDESDPQKMKIFRLKADNRRFWSPSAERGYYSPTQNKATHVIDKMMKFSV